MSTMIRYIGEILQNATPRGEREEGGGMDDVSHEPVCYLLNTNQYNFCSDWLKVVDYADIKVYDEQTDAQLA